MYVILWFCLCKRSKHLIFFAKIDSDIQVNFAQCSSRSKSLEILHCNGLAAKSWLLVVKKNKNVF